MRVRRNLVQGALGASLTDVGTSITFDAIPGLPTLAGGEYVTLTIGDTEVAYLTAYTAGETTGTISRGEEGTTAVAHDSGTNWHHGPTTGDFTTVHAPLLTIPGSRPTSGSGSSFASKGTLLQAMTDMTIVAVWVHVFQASGSTYQGWAAKTTSAGALVGDAKLAGTAASSPTNAAWWMSFGALASPLDVDAGEWFVVGCIRTDGAATAVNGVVVGDMLAGSARRGAEATWQGAYLAAGLTNGATPASLGSSSYVVAYSWQQR